MKKPEFKTKQILKSAGFAILVMVTLAGLRSIVLNIYHFANDPAAEIAKHDLWHVPQKFLMIYPYNERVPKSVVEAEIRKQAEQFSLDPDMMVALAKCESDLDNLAKNDDSTALGVYQYLIKTWEETESFKTKRIARTDYKANIHEAMIDMSEGEIWRWKDCAGKIGLKNDRINSQITQVGQLP